MKKIFLILLIFLCLPFVLGDICQDVVVGGQECQLVSPVLSCSNSSYSVLDNSGILVQDGVLVPFSNQTFYFNFVQGVGEYVVILSCDNWTREIYVVDEARSNSMISSGMFGVLFLFLFVIGICIFLYFYNRDDIWLQGLSLILGVVTFMFLIVVSISVNEVQMGYQTGFDRSVVGETDYNSLNVSYFSVINSNRYLLQFDSFNVLDVVKFESAELCLKYNNSDGSNSLSVYSGSGKLSQNYLLSSNSLGEVCLDFKAFKIYNGVYLGVVCADCDVGNSLGLGMDLDASNVSLTVMNQSGYLMSSSKPFIYEVRTRYPPFDSIRSWFFTYIWILGFFVLAFGIRSIVMIIVKTKEVVED